MIRRVKKIFAAFGNPNQRSYTKSNSTIAVDFVPSQEAKACAGKLLASSHHEIRQAWGEALVHELSGNCGIDLPKLKVSDTRQQHSVKNGRLVLKRYGYYQSKTSYIYIQNLTARRGQTLAPKTFLDTLLHEWMHHYDSQKLAIRSLHTKGFYLRLASLKSLL